MDRRKALKFVAASAFAAADSGHASPRPDAVATHTNDVWVETVLRRMLSVQRGQTRGDLLKVFTTEGGLATSLHRTFVSLDCPYFKVDVPFRQAGRMTLKEDDRDVISSISKPYPAWAVRCI